MLLNLAYLHSSAKDASAGPGAGGEGGGLQLGKDAALEVSLCVWWFVSICTNSH